MRAAVRPLFCSLVLVAVSLGAAAPAAAAAAALDPLLAHGKLWELSQDEFQAATRGLPFRWVSAARDSARAADRPVTLFGQPVVEVIARFKDDKLQEITALFYARGDAGELPRDKFEATVRSSTDAISTHTQAKFTVRGKDATNAVKAEGLVWQTDQARYLLEYSFTREVKSRDIPFRAEFVRLEITPPPKASSRLATATTSTSKPKFNGPSHVQRDAASGDVWLRDVPMVDQGQKGYCVVATTERVMRYYGASVDANELAQVANTSTTGGTSSDAMRDALKKLAARLRVRVRSVEDMNAQDYIRLIADYNRAAKRAKEPEIPAQGNMIDVGAVYAAMNADVLREVRTKNKGDLSRFQRTVQARIEEGVPLLWCVHLGLLPEKGIPQSGGGHMRLIIGFNNKTREILYSDSWGAGHELKRMPAEDAWTVTTQIMTIEPIS